MQFYVLKLSPAKHEGHCLLFTYCPVSSLTHLPLTVLLKKNLFDCISSMQDL